MNLKQGIWTTVCGLFVSAFIYFYYTNFEIMLIATILIGGLLAVLGIIEFVQFVVEFITVIYHNLGR